MGHQSLKLELIEWILKLENSSTLTLLQAIKDSGSESDDWGKTLSEEEKAGIISGLEDIEKGRIVTHEDVRAKYGL